MSALASGERLAQGAYSFYFFRHSCLPPYRFAPLLQKNATLEDPSRVIVTASIAGLGVGSLGENATFGYSASKGTVNLLSPVKLN